MTQPLENSSIFLPQDTFTHNPSQLNSIYTTHTVSTVPYVQHPMPALIHQVNMTPNLSEGTAVRLKRMSLPTFSGLRKDWPEFRAVWKSMAESANHNKTALAHELKNSVRGEAKNRIKSVYITKPEAYEVMWKKLEEYYEDTSASVQAALEDLKKLKPVQEEDYKSLVKLVDDVEAAYNQLRKLNYLNTLSMRYVDALSDLLPTHLKIDWRGKYSNLCPAEKLQPKGTFYSVSVCRESTCKETRKPPYRWRNTLGSQRVFQVCLSDPSKRKHESHYRTV